MLVVSARYVYRETSRNKKTLLAHCTSTATLRNNTIDEHEFFSIPSQVHYLLQASGKGPFR